jgi:hypothetical protein
MDILGNRKFVEISGGAIHELPPLLVHAHAPIRRLDRVMDLATHLVETEDLVPPHPLDELAGLDAAAQRKMDMAVNLVERYLALVKHWQWGDDILEWIRQCEITFEQREALRSILRPDLWPHAGRSSFVTLLEDKAVPTPGVHLEQAVGLRLTFRKPPAIDVFSDQFLLYLDEKLAHTAYQAWSGLSAAPVSSLPPERFAVNVHVM